MMKILKNSVQYVETKSRATIMDFWPAKAARFHSIYFRGGGGGGGTETGKKQNACCFMSLILFLRRGWDMVKFGPRREKFGEEQDMFPF